VSFINLVFVKMMKFNSIFQHWVSENRRIKKTTACVNLSTHKNLTSFFLNCATKANLPDACTLLLWHETRRFVPPDGKLEHLGGLLDRNLTGTGTIQSRRSTLVVANTGQRCCRVGRWKGPLRMKFCTKYWSRSYG